MDAADFAARTKFRFFDETSDLRRWPAAQRFLERFHLPLEIANTRLPTRRRLSRQRLEPLLSMPRMSSYALGAVINAGVAAMPPGTVYLNIGVWHGFSFFCGIVGNEDRVCIGVDDFSRCGGPREEFLERYEQWRSPRTEFYDMDFEDYLRSEHDGRPIGFYIYDAGHSYEHQLSGLELAEPFFVPGTVILVDDTNWKSARRATIHFQESRGSAYELVTYRHTAFNNHPTFWNGVMLLRRS